VTGGRAGLALLPPALRGWPAVLRTGGAPGDLSADAVDALLERIRAETLWWPAPRSGAPAPRALALDAAGLATARARWDDAAVARADDPAAVAPDRLEAVFGPPGAPAALWAALGGCGGPGAPDPAAALAAARAVCSWTGAALTLQAGLDAQALLRRAAQRPGGRAGLVAMSRWKRRCLRPFLTGPDGPPVAVGSVAQARARGLTPVVWGAATAPDAGDPDADDPAAPLLVEDGFLRSVGLGVRHAPPASLAISRRRPHFDATGPNAFDAVVAAARFEPALLARAEALAARIVALGLTKYNLSGAGEPPEAGGRLKLLAAGQVAADASIRLGARAIRNDLDLLRAARARFPDAFILYKPHPDVRTGLRAGAAPAAEVARLADAGAGDMAAAACLAWCDRVITVTSLIGFEALLRGKPATVCGRPFYAGWGLTDDLDPPPRDRRLSRAALVAAALILLPSYVDPRSGLPAPPEVVVEALARERAAAGRPAARLRRLWRHGVSTLLNRL